MHEECRFYMGNRRRSPRGEEALTGPVQSELTTAHVRWVSAPCPGRTPRRRNPAAAQCWRSRNRAARWKQRPQGEPHARSRQPGDPHDGPNVAAVGEREFHTSGSGAAAERKATKSTRLHGPQAFQINVAQTAGVTAVALAIVRCSKRTRTSAFQTQVVHDRELRYLDARGWQCSNWPPFSCLASPPVTAFEK